MRQPGTRQMVRLGQTVPDSRHPQPRAWCGTGRRWRSPPAPHSPAPHTDRGRLLLGVTCPSTNRCTAVDAVGQEVTFDPASPGHPRPATIDDGGGGPIGAVCFSGSQCTVVDENGREVTFDSASPGLPNGQEATFTPTAPGTPAVASIYNDFLQAVGVSVDQAVHRARQLRGRGNVQPDSRRAQLPPPQSATASTAAT